MKILRYFLLLGLVSIEQSQAKKKSKLKSLLQHRDEYKDVIVFVYGDIENERFLNSAEVFQLNIKPLENCPSFNDKKCQEKLKLELEKIKGKTIVLVVKAENNLLNCQAEDVFKIFNEIEMYEKVMKSAAKEEDYGWNIIGDKDKILEHLEHVKARPDGDRNYFFDVDDFEDFGGTKLHGVQRVTKTGHLTIPLVFQQKFPPKKDKFDHFLNIMNQVRKLNNPNFQFEFPKIFVCLIVPDLVLFLEEFVENFHNQDYPKEKMEINVIATKPDNKMKITKLLQEYSAFRNVQIDQLKIGEGVAKCLKNFDQSSSEFILFFQSRAILEETDTIKKLVTQNYSISAPYLITNKEIPKYHLNCSLGWNRFSESWIGFPPAMSTILTNIDTQRFLEGVNYSLFESKASSVDDWSNFWKVIFSHKQDTEQRVMANAVLVDNQEFPEKVRNGKYCCMIRVESLRSLFLVKKKIIQKINLEKLTQISNLTEFNNLMSEELKKLAPMKMLTDKNYGQLVNLLNFPTDSKTPELLRTFENFALWEKRYILPSATTHIVYDGSTKPKKYDKEFFKPTKCPDVFTFQLFTSRYIDDIYKEAQITTNKTIPLWKIGLEDDMLAILNFYVNDLICMAVFDGHHKESSSGDFHIQHIKAGETIKLDPVHSSVEINVIVPLNQYGKDYEGGGIYFPRYDCSVQVPKGTGILFPGELTHNYVNNPVTSGTFSIMSLKLEHDKHRCHMENGATTCPGFTKNPKK